MNGYSWMSFQCRQYAQQYVTIRWKMSNSGCYNNFLKSFPISLDTKKFQIKLPISPKYTGAPDYIKSRKIGYHVEQLVDLELQRLQEADVIERTDFSEWAVPIVVVKRADGRVRSPENRNKRIHTQGTTIPSQLNIWNDAYQKISTFSYSSSLTGPLGRPPSLLAA